MVIAAALAQISGADNRTSAVLLLDEPTAALDLAYQLEVATLLRDLHRHADRRRRLDPRSNFAAGLCRTFVLLKEGLVIAAGPTADVLTPANIRALYGVEAEVQLNAGAGHLVVVPFAASRPGHARDRPRRIATATIGFGALALAGGRAGAALGSTSISLARAFDWSVPFADNIDAQIFFVARLPRTLAGAIVGAALATAGVVFQGLLRNPLATPFTLGVSSGAALGAMLAITFDWTLGFAGISAVARPFVGAAMRGRRSFMPRARAITGDCRPTCCSSPESR